MVIREESIKAFNEIEVELKKTLQHLRHETNSKLPLFSGQEPPNTWQEHEPAYFAAVHNLSDKQLTNFSGISNN